MMKAFYIPNGPKNLAGLFPSVNFGNLAEYYLEVKTSAGTVIASTTRTIVDNKCCADKVRLRFLNYSGAIDGMNFQVVMAEHEAKSTSYMRPTKANFAKTDHKINRFNVTANNTITISNISYNEKDMNWVNEMVDSPLCWMEWKGTQGQSDGYIPVIIKDTKILNVKDVDRYVYEVQMQIELSNDKFIIRN